MAPLWKNMIESGKTQIIYCVDASAPERVGQAAINLIGKTLDRELGTKGDNKEPPGDRHTKIYGYYGRQRQRQFSRSYPIII